MSNNETEKDVENSEEADVSDKRGKTNFDRECMCSGLDSFIVCRLRLDYQYCLIFNIHVFST